MASNNKTKKMDRNSVCFSTRSLQEFCEYEALRSQQTGSDSWKADTVIEQKENKSRMTMSAETQNVLYAR